MNCKSYNDAFFLMNINILVFSSYLHFFVLLKKANPKMIRMTTKRMSFTYQMNSKNEDLKVLVPLNTNKGKKVSLKILPFNKLQSVV